MALEFIIYSGNQENILARCLDCSSATADMIWPDPDETSTLCPRCNGSNLIWINRGYKNGDIITLDYSPSEWSDSEKRTVVYMDDDEVIKLIAALGFSSEDDIWEYLDAPKKENGLLVERKSYKVNCDFVNTDGNFIVIKAENIVKK